MAFDADNREFSISEEKNNSNFKKLYKFNCIVSNKNDEKLDFYLTKNPFCSSTLKPDFTVTSQYVYEDYFEINKKVKINNISLSIALKKLQINKIDWLKTDSQGIDLRIYKSLKQEVQDHILAIDFEPGLLATYQGEDTVFQIMSYMNQKKGFWLSGFDVQGVFRGTKQIYDNLFHNFIYKKLAKMTLKKAPKWVEMRYLNSLDYDDKYTIREYLLTCIFSMINKEYLNTLKLADKGFELFQDNIFRLIRNATITEIKKSFFHKNLIIKFEKKIISLFK